MVGDLGLSCVPGVHYIPISGQARPTDLPDMHIIVVYPVGGWCKYRTAQDRWQNSVRYSLIVAIDVPDEYRHIRRS